VASSTLGTASKLVTVTGGTTLTQSYSALNSSSQKYAEFLTSTESTSQPAPTGSGLLCDATTLEGNTLASGTYTLKFKFWSGPAITSVDMILRIYKRSSGGTYTSIGSATLSGQAITTTANTAYTITTGTLAAMAFVTGDKV
jgi:hypothetical protein